MMTDDRVVEILLGEKEKAGDLEVAVAIDIALKYIAERQKEHIDSINIFDIEEVYDNCTVQILSSSITGEVSVGWWKNE